MKKFSFVIPTYQNGSMVKNTLESLNHQKGYTSNDYEVILVDDGSTDNTKEYIKGINRNYDLKYIYLERNAESCRSIARNRGWKEASGEIIVFIDGDIIIKDDHLSEIDRCMSVSENILLIGNNIMLMKHIPYEEIKDRKAFKKEISDKGIWGLDPRQFLYYAFSYNISIQEYPWFQVYSCNMAVRRKWLEVTGGFEESFKGWGHEDIELGYRMYKKGLKIAVSSKLDVFHQCSPENPPCKPYKYENKSLSEEAKKNMKAFLNKHTDAFNLPVDVVVSLFKSLYGIYTVQKPKRLFKKIKLNFKDKKQLEKLKQKITALSGEKGMDIMVYDYVEDTDLDIWIQLLGDSAAVIRYYPVSKVREFKNTLGYRLLFFKLRLLKLLIIRRLRSFGP